MAKKKKVTRNKKFSKKPINKMRLAVRNFILFAALALASFIAYGLVDGVMLSNFFQIMFIIFGALGATFLLVIIVLFLLKNFKK